MVGTQLHTQVQGVEYVALVKDPIHHLTAQTQL